jgi:hypothetical protein
MTPTPPPRTVTVEIDGERRVLNGRFCALFLDLLSWYDAINKWGGGVKVMVNCKGGGSVKSSVEFFKE